MKIRVTLLALLLICIDMTQAQQAENTLPYYEIPDYPANYNAGTVAARMVDGLGFRYYWATEGLREVDLNYKTGEGARTALQTAQHIYGLVDVILNSTLKQVNGPSDSSTMSFEELRAATLKKIKRAADILRESEDISEYKIVFKRGDATTEYPFWNQINGPIADALWHCGQMVTLRRASGNPFNSKASLLAGKVRQ